MTRRHTPWPAGIPCWTDLTAPDVDAAKAFYRAVIGWTFAPTDDAYGGYTLAEVDGDAAAGIGPQQEGAPNAWTMYFASDDVDATASAISTNGGTVLYEPSDVGPLGRMCIAMDPTGAAFGVWQAGEHIGASVVNEPGGLTWEDLRSPDPDAARAFYAAVFGHRMEAMPEAGPDYAMFARPDEPAPLGGMGGMMGAPAGTPPHWAVYFSVIDADDALATAAQAGGTTIAPAFDTAYGRMAGLADPWGAVFWINEATDDQPQPDRSA